MTTIKTGSLSYRADIDGLRSIAVTSVVLYHAGVTRIPGGYVGVDIFFVISGYLITSIIASELEVGHFSILSFYERRIRRIFPALIAMATVTSVAAWFLLMPVAFKEYGESVATMASFTGRLMGDPDENIPNSNAADDRGIDGYRRSQHGCAQYENRHATLDSGLSLEYW